MAKRYMSVFILLAVAALLLFLWGRLALNIILHPLRAIEVIVLPSLFLSVLIVIGAWLLRGSKEDGHRPENTVQQLGRSMQQKTTEQLLDIVFGDRSKWTTVALQEAERALKPRLLTPHGIDALSQYKAMHFDVDA